jgi:hypothetical protein
MRDASFLMPSETCILTRYRTGMISRCLRHGESRHLIAGTVISPLWPFGEFFVARQFVAKPNQNPEQIARDQIDKRLGEAGWRQTTTLF